jgi:hypothetical protein
MDRTTGVGPGIINSFGVLIIRKNLLKLSSIEPAGAEPSKPSAARILSPCFHAVNAPMLKPATLNHYMRIKVKGLKSEQLRVGEIRPFYQGTQTAAALPPPLRKRYNPAEGRLEVRALESPVKGIVKLCERVRCCCT